jgi:hypothetical protein
MQRIAIVLFISSELLYYLLIAQTGVIEYFSSDIFLIAPLPIGGIIGSLIIFYLKFENKYKITFFLFLQLSMSFLYPDLTFVTLFILGISVGAIGPLMINELKKSTYIELALALCLAYSIGTLLFTYDVSQRGNLSILFSIIAIISTQFLPNIIIRHAKTESYSLLIMVLWIFLDSALFETLSRDLSISIWRDGFTLEIIVFHIIGIIAAFNFKFEKKYNELFIVMLFAFSYLFYFLRESFILSIIYPFVISYYNVVILQTIFRKDLRSISIYMIFIGWLASGGGLFVALENYILFVPIIFLIVILKVLSNSFQNKEIQYV